MNKTLQDYLSSCLDRGVIDHAIRATRQADGTITFYIHPHGIDGDTIDFKVGGNTLETGPWCQEVAR